MSSKAPTEKVTEMVMDASSKVISAFNYHLSAGIQVGSFFIIVLKYFPPYSTAPPTATKLSFSN